MTAPSDRLEVWPWTWPEVRGGDDLAELVARSAAETSLIDGDVVVLTSKVVSKAEGAARQGDRADVAEAESVRVVARRGSTVISETRHGLVLAAAGVDTSNVPAGQALTLPADPDASARRLRAEIAARLGANVAVIVSDTAGRAWREGQTDLAIGCAGIDPLLDLRGQPDAGGQTLIVTTPAVADEVAALGDLVKGKASGRPAAVVRGLARLVLPRGEDGPGAAALVRDAESDLFGLGVREAAVAAAVRDDAGALRRFPRRADGDDSPFDRLASPVPDVSVVVSPAVGGWALQVCVREGAADRAWLEAGRLVERAATLAAAHRLAERPVTGMSDTHRVADGWRAVHSVTWVVA
jgi:coenzyme F420-0:L-glutamate ligase/coenzyme F420-1:gamma-L-glutamate ligase